jgi:hypothetical protein
VSCRRLTQARFEPDHKQGSIAVRAHPARGATSMPRPSDGRQATASRRVLRTQARCRPRRFAAGAPAIRKRFIAPFVRLLSGLAPRPGIDAQGEPQSKCKAPEAQVCFRLDLASECGAGATPAQLRRQRRHAPTNSSVHRATRRPCAVADRPRTEMDLGSGARCAATWSLWSRRSTRPAHQGLCSRWRDRSWILRACSL